MHQVGRCPGVLRCLTLVIWLVAGSTAANAIAAPATPVATGAGDTGRALYGSVKSAQLEAVYAATAGRLSRYRVDARFTPAAPPAIASITGTLDLRWINQTPAPRDAVPFRLYPNIDVYEDGGLTITSATAAGSPAPVALSVGDTVATVQLPRLVETGDAIDLLIDFTTTVPTSPTNSYGMFAYDPASDSYTLAHWLPLLAGLDPDGSWVLDPPSQFGDPVFTNTALFDVTLTAPADLTFVTTGHEIDAQADGTLMRQRIVSGPVRDFVMAASSQWSEASTEVDGTGVTSYFREIDRDAGEQVLEIAAAAMRIFNESLGEYPYRDFKLVQVEIGNGAGGVEFPQLVYIGNDYYRLAPQIRASDDYLPFIVAHEVAHQWFYGLVGNNQYRHAFMDESLANYLTVVYVEHVAGPDAAQRQIELNLMLRYFQRLFSIGDLVVDQPTDDFPSIGAYGAIVYGKGALGFRAIREEIGSDAFFEGLRQYVAHEMFAVATPADLETSFASAAGRSLREVWNHWFEEAAGKQDFDASDLQRVLDDLQNGP